MNAEATLSLPTIDVENSHRALTIYLDHLAPSGRRSMRSLLQRVGECCDWHGPLEHWPWLSLRYADLMSMRSALQAEQLSANSINTCLAAVRGILKVGFQLGVFPHDAWLHVQSVANVSVSRSAKGRQLTAREVQRLMTACRHDPNPRVALRDEAILTVLLYAGLRRAELVQLQISDFDTRLGDLHIRCGKGQKSRNLPLPIAAKQVLKIWLKKRGTLPGPMFVQIDQSQSIGKVGGFNQPFSALTPHQVYALLRRRCSQAGIAQCSPHDLRRTFVSRLLELGVDLNTARQLAGHEHIQTTSLYDRRGEKQQRQAMAQFRL
ncbi:tyrosine-type recombinase/integrase [Methylomonas sp. HYX-M1]|uniref:tyrosine-type recombinase/integrase n=1 Tax=Methylomonas sp. HYX-M1 TaxID=3139307 RepID=UPI00345C4A57